MDKVSKVKFTVALLIKGKIRTNLNSQQYGTDYINSDYHKVKHYTVNKSKKNTTVLMNQKIFIIYSKAK